MSSNKVYLKFLICSLYPTKYKHVERSKKKINPVPRQLLCVQTRKILTCLSEDK